MTLNGAETPVTLAEDGDVYLTVEAAAVTGTGAAAVLHREGVPRLAMEMPIILRKKSAITAESGRRSPGLTRTGPAGGRL